MIVTIIIFNTFVSLNFQFFTKSTYKKEAKEDSTGLLKERRKDSVKIVCRACEVGQVSQMLRASVPLLV